MPPILSDRHRKVETPIPSFPFWSVPAGDVRPPLTSGLNDWNTGLGSAAAELNREWLEFLNRRLREDLAFPRRLASCKGVAGAWEMYAEFCQVAVTDYLKEFAKLVELGSCAAASTANAIQTDLIKSGKEQARGSARH